MTKCWKNKGTGRSKYEQKRGLPPFGDRPRHREKGRSVGLVRGEVGRLEEERAEDGQSPRLQPRDLADAGDGVDETTVPEGHDGPGEEEGEEDEEADATGEEANDCGQDETDFHVVYDVLIVEVVDLVVVIRFD